MVKLLFFSSIFICLGFAPQITLAQSVYQPPIPTLPKGDEKAQIQETISFTPPKSFRAIMSAGNEDYHSTSWAPMGDNGADPHVLLILTGYRRDNHDPQKTMAPIIRSAQLECMSAKETVKSVDNEIWWEAACPPHGKRREKSLMIRIILGEQRVYILRFQAKGKLTMFEKNTSRQWLYKAKLIKSKIDQSASKS